MVTVNEVLKRNAEHNYRVFVQSQSFSDDGDTTLSFNYTLIEGDSEALQFLGELLIAMSKSEDCDIQIHPSGAGLVHFSEGSNVGLIIHKLPCEHGSKRRED